MKSDDKVIASEEALDGELFTLIGSLPDGALISETGLARIFGRHPSAIKRAIDRGELPPPVYLMKRPVFSIGCIRRFLQNRFQQALEEHEHLQNTLKKHRNVD